MAFLRKKREEPRVELTPMVDVVFNLLIFFMISTTFVETAGIEIKLPEASAQRVEKTPEEVKVYLSVKGEIFFEDEEVSLAEFRRRLQAFPQAEETTFLLLADREATHGRVVQLMDLARESGFSRLAIATEEQGR
jgi:biopolymer transport protein ExbD